MSDDKFDWEEEPGINIDARMIRAQLGREDYNELKSMAAKSEQTIQKFIGGILKSFIRKAKKRENSTK